MTVIRRLLGVSLLIVTATCLALSGCGGQTSQAPQAPQPSQSTQAPEQPKPAQRVEITFASGGAGGPMHTITSALATLWNDKVPGVNVTNSATTASVVNCRMVNENKAQLAFTMSDISFLAMRGQEMFKEPLKNVLGFASFHNNYVHIIARKDSRINSVNDLRGKRVGVGAPGSGTEFNARCILEAAGMTYKDLAKADYLSYAETCEQLGNGNIDAGFLTGGLPIAAITEMATTKDIKVIPVTGDILVKLQQTYPIYFASEIPGGLYKGVDEPVKTVALKNYIVINRDVPEEMAYSLVKATYENWDRVAASHASLKDVSLQTALEGMQMQLHPGVERYYREKGLLK